MAVSNFLTKLEKANILQAIKVAEKETSGEIRVHLESRCKNPDTLQRAREVFDSMKMHHTHLHNGTLIYFAVKDRKFAIYGDSGINEIVPDNFWDDVKQNMEQHFKKGNFADGIIHGIGEVGQKLKEYFPYRKDDTNELPDDISFDE